MRLSALHAAALSAGLLCLPPAFADQEPAKEPATKPTGVRLQGDDGGGRRVRLGGIGVGVGYSRGWPMYGYGPRYWGPGWYGGSAAWNPWAFGPGWGWYDPFWYSPLAVHPGYWMGFGRGEGMGEVKLDTDVSQASVYIDGAYAGSVRDRRNMWLRPGNYELQVRDGDKQLYAQRIYVLSGKTLRIRPDLAQAREVTR